MTGADVADTASDRAIGKFLPEGDTAWTRRFDFGPLEVLYRPAVDLAGNLIAPGYTGDFSRLMKVIMEVAPGGETLWARIERSRPDVVFVGADVDPRGRIFVTGFGGDDENIDILVVCLDSLGSKLWRRTFDFSADDEGLGIVVGLDGDLYLTGNCEDGDCVLIKLTTEGNPIWRSDTILAGMNTFRMLRSMTRKILLSVGLPTRAPSPLTCSLPKFHRSAVSPNRKRWHPRALTFRSSETGSCSFWHWWRDGMRLRFTTRAGLR